MVSRSRTITTACRTVIEPAWLLVFGLPNAPRDCLTPQKEYKKSQAAGNEKEKGNVQLSNFFLLLPPKMVSFFCRHNTTPMILILCCRKIPPKFGVCHVVACRNIVRTSSAGSAYETTVLLVFAQWIHAWHCVFTGNSGSFSIKHTALDITARGVIVLFLFCFLFFRRSNPAWVQEP
jgi:hypothetical protein